MTVMTEKVLQPLPPMTRRASSVVRNHHRRFATVGEYVEELGGEHSFVIEKVLIANNGVGAVKCIRSIRKWAYEIFGDERAVTFVVMATPEDLKANAEYIRMGDIIVDVPGGSNNHNYANVTLIVELARLHRVHAVWAGWGHASENPVLPDTLERSNPPIKFIGPAGPPMRALGDKIGSTIIAQSAGVPCIAWNGQNVKAEYCRETGSLPEKAYREASIHSVAEAVEASGKIGFPVMIKASEGGGGKGIRQVSKLEDVATAYRQVCGEVPGSPIFIMKLSAQSRHLEVQLLADEYGNAIALNGRDCSVQRRHQKIIEEGPPVACSPEVWPEMEKAAVSLAKAVGYANAGTVEYLYSEVTGKFFFLELNPRLQVEHPVTEMITRVNLPACQLQVAMGIPLYNIPDVRELYSKHRFETGETAIDFDTAPRVPPYGHCIAVRITAENAEAGFKPTSGGIQELNFRSTPNVWGYFSMDSSGSIHEFADSQFGHLFASGKDREQARRNMVLALKELSIRGDISTTVEYIAKLIELDDFVENRIDTQWLDKLIKENVEGIGSAVEGGVTKSEIDDHTSVTIGATITAFTLCNNGEQQYSELLKKGQLPPLSLLKMDHNIELILNDVKYMLSCERSSPSTFKISLLDQPNKFVQTNIRVLSDGGYLIALSGKSHVAYVTSKLDGSTGLRLNLDGANILFSTDYDPTSLKTDVAGKLVKKLVADGAHVEKGEAYAEIEVMKMFMPLKVEEKGVITWQSNEGAGLASGDVLASLQLDNPENVATFLIFEGDLDVPGWTEAGAILTDIPILSKPHHMFRNAEEKIRTCVAGYTVTDDELELAMSELLSAVIDPMLPVYEIEEQLSVLVGRIDATLFSDISRQLTDFETLCDGGDQSARFPAGEVERLITDCAHSLKDPASHTAFLTLTSGLRGSLTPYVKKDLLLPGSQRALKVTIELLREFIAAERWFSDSPSYADTIERLRKAYPDNNEAILDICRMHSQLESTSKLIEMLFASIRKSIRSKIASGMKPEFLYKLPIFSGEDNICTAALSELGSMSGNETLLGIALSARKLLLQGQMPSINQRTDKLKALIQGFASNDKDVTKSGLDLPFADLFFPILALFKGNVKYQFGLIELLVRKLYFMHDIKEVVKTYDERMMKIVFMTAQSENVLSSGSSVKSMTDLTRMLSRSTSMNKLQIGEGDDSDSLSDAGEAPSQTQRTGIVKLVENVKDAEDPLFIQSIAKAFPQNQNGDSKSQADPLNVLYIVVGNEKMSSNDADKMSTQCELILKPMHAELAKAGVRRVSFILGQNAEAVAAGVMGTAMPAIFTFRAFINFKEDTLFRNLEPSLAYLLNLNRLAENFSVRSLGSTHSTAKHIHLYKATPKESALVADPKANKLPRVFIRCLCFVASKVAVQEFEQTFVDAMNALEMTPHHKQSGGKSTDNHLFLNFVGAAQRVLDPVIIERVIGSALKRHGDRMSQLGIAEVEVRLVCRLNEESPPIAIRMVASNPTGYVLVMNSYVEAADDSNTKSIFKLIGGTKTNIAGTGDSSWEGMSINYPYPLTRPFDSQRKAALKSSDTLYCYDIPALFEAVIEQQWNKISSADEGMFSSKPLMVMNTTEMVVQRKNCTTTGSWTIEDYMNGNLELAPVYRGAGANDVGMVAWLMVLHTVEYPDGRQIIVIANDITHKAGSFGTREDVVFKLASELAREKMIPRLYVAANSGARIGLSESVKKAFKVAFKDPLKPENGFDFLYVTKDDYEQFAVMNRSIMTEPVTLNGEEVYKITDIIGTEQDLGVENLKGSGMIAGETSLAYNDIFTLTIVLGRTVGIGAYLVRLGQRTIQKATASPIILTGYQALNKLMGCDVYSTNDQLGGPGIMYNNGISHLVTSDHFQAISESIKWLSYIPSARGGLLPITDIRGVDSIERKIEFSPSAGVPYDSRFLITGGENDEGSWESGFFDKGSFTETMAGWAKSVVVGRARLGGIPMAVIATENRMVETVKPADPADVRASETVIQEPGCVWFPNSAYKTAQAIKDFRIEDLPLMILANWRGFSGGQRDMFEEVLKYGSLIVDALVAYEQPVFVFIPPYAEVRGGAWVVIDSAINPNVMEMYAASKTSRGGVLEANGAASVKYRTKDLIVTMHRLDETMKDLDTKLKVASGEEQETIKQAIKQREQALLPVYEQVSVQFCDLHDTPGRMKAVGVVEHAVEWENARTFFFWRLRRKLAEFDLRKKMQQSAEVGRGLKVMTPLEASSMMKDWFLQTPGMSPAMWNDDKAVLGWMAQNNSDLENKVGQLTLDCVTEEVYRVVSAGGDTAKVGTAGVLEGLGRAYRNMGSEDKAHFKKMLANMFV